MPAILRPFTSESVSEGHPDKICDQISDAVLDACLEKDRHSRVACECYATTGLVLVGGEISTRTYVDIQGIARSVVKQIGYDNPEYGLDWASMAVLNASTISRRHSSGRGWTGSRSTKGKQGAGIRDDVGFA
jgi:S-adenosylmethionine synthetase